MMTDNGANRRISEDHVSDKTERIDIESVEMCFGCGKANPIGLKLELKKAGETASAEFMPQDVHQGYGGIVHGGIMSALLDEMAGRLLYELGYKAVTARIEVRFKRPASVGKPICLFSKIHEKKGRVILTHSEAKSEQGKLLAEATASFVLA